MDDNKVEKSKVALLRVEQNDPQLLSISIVGQDHSMVMVNSTSRINYFWVQDEADLSRLGNAIGNNTHLIKISFHKSSEWMSSFNTKPFFEGLQRNTNIEHLSLDGGIDIEILNKYATPPYQQSICFNVIVI